MGRTTFIDLSGNRFGKFLVIDRDIRRKNKTYWNCICDCGKCKSVEAHSLRLAKSRSCGCGNKESKSTRNFQHGYTQYPEYNIWKKMVNRCINIESIDFKYYGGRGITVCDKWLNSFENFYSDMGSRPSKEYSIDRINNDGNYEPENCHWATRWEQGKNRRNNIVIEAFGEKKIFMEWCRTLNIERHYLRLQLRKGVSLENIAGIMGRTYVSGII